MSRDIPKCSKCGCSAIDHVVDDEERRECCLCECEQFEAPSSMDTISLAAKVAHEVNRAYCESIGDDSQVPWTEAPDWQKQSAVEGVRAISADPCLSPESIHGLWCKDKMADGWVYGPKKDAEAKTHPCLVPYIDLPKEQQTKDALFSAAVRSVLGVDGQ